MDWLAPHLFGDGEAWVAMQRVPMPDHRQLRVWDRAHALSVFVYRRTEVLDANAGARHYALQLRRATSSIAANVAEGCAQESSAQFARYLSVAIGSAAEALNHVTEVRSLVLISETDACHIEEELQHIRAMLVRLRQHLRSNRRRK